MHHDLICGDKTLTLNWSNAFAIKKVEAMKELVGRNPDILDYNSGGIAIWYKPSIPTSAFNFYRLQIEDIIDGDLLHMHFMYATVKITLSPETYRALPDLTHSAYYHIPRKHLTIVSHCLGISILTISLIQMFDKGIMTMQQAKNIYSTLLSTGNITNTEQSLEICDKLRKYYSGNINMQTFSQHTNLENLRIPDELLEITNYNNPISRTDTLVVKPINSGLTSAKFHATCTTDSNNKRLTAMKRGLIASKTNNGQISGGFESSNTNKITDPVKNMYNVAKTNLNNITEPVKNMYNASETNTNNITDPVKNTYDVVETKRNTNTPNVVSIYENIPDKPNLEEINTTNVVSIYENIGDKPDKPNLGEINANDKKQTSDESMILGSFKSTPDIKTTKTRYNYVDYSNIIPAN